MRRLFGGATLLFAAISADAGIIRADFRTAAGLPGYGSFGSLGASDGLTGSAFLSNPGGVEGSRPWLDLDPVPNTLPPQAQAGFDFHAFHIALANIAGPGVIGTTFLAATPAADDTPIPEPETLALFGLGASALGLARQGKGKRA
jgi:hypothetical protein